MYYSIIGLLAMAVLSIENYDILLNRNNRITSPVWMFYRRFLFAVLVYYITDVLWGVFENHKMVNMLIIDTMVYFVAMAVGILLWTKYATTYLDEKSFYAAFLLYSGRIFFIAVSLISVINIFTPVLFYVDYNCVYHTKPVRYVLLAAQIVMLLLGSIYAFSAMVRRSGEVKKRYRTIAFFGLIMAVFLTVQLWFPYLPLYSIAYMLGTCILHSFVVNDEKEEYRYKLEKASEKEKYHHEELNAARALAYRDALTGVKSKLAYNEAEKKKNREIDAGHELSFAVAVFDVNELKDINDKMGHEQGDQHLIVACRMICNHFKHSPVFRVGGDEFVAILEGDDYQNRQDLNESFNLLMESGNDDNVIIAMGMSDYVEGRDKTLNDVFVRADRLMYQRKNELKMQPV
ncbi:MAG: GGDEF domain-containing protein [Clostridiales bacterium]|nr:GGDEF domain-containing protein [Clostridiales bacterium]